MDKHISSAKQQLARNKQVLLCLYPGLVSTGSPFYINEKSRVATKLVFACGTKRCVAVARLLLEAALGRRLAEDETCDHKDGKPLNNKRSNLQVLSRAENARKGPTRSTRASVSMSNKLRMLGVAQPHNAGALNGKSKLTDAQVCAIKASSSSLYVRGNDKVLAAVYGVSRGLISQIRRGVVRKA